MSVNKNSRTNRNRRSRLVSIGMVSPRIKRHLKQWRKLRDKESAAVTSELKEHYRMLAYAHAETVCELHHGYQ